MNWYASRTSSSAVFVCIVSKSQLGANSLILSFKNRSLVSKLLHPEKQIIQANQYNIILEKKYAEWAGGGGVRC